MNMPGFTAEVSLYKTAEPYYMGTAGRSVPQGLSPRVVHPAIVFRPPPCRIICPRCVAAGGDCIPVLGGCLCA
jgi:hypothetical protein